MAKAIRDNSPPDTIFCKSFISSPKFAENKNSTSSAPFSEKSLLSHKFIFILASGIDKDFSSVIISSVNLVALCSRNLCKVAASCFNS